MKNIKTILKLLIIIGILVYIAPTLARYFSTVIVDSKEYDLAKWDVIVNNDNITNKSQLTERIPITWFENPYINSNQVAPGSIGYFDINIDTRSSEIASTCSISLDVSDEYSNAGIKIMGYEVGENIPENPTGIPEFYYSAENGKIIENILLEDNKGKLVKNRIYVKWQDKCDNESQVQLAINKSDFSLNVVVDVEQYIGGNDIQPMLMDNKAGLYEAGTNNLIYSWSDLIDLGVFENKTTIDFVYNKEYLVGDLYINRGITQIGNYQTYIENIPRDPWSLNTDFDMVDYQSVSTGNERDKYEYCFYGCDGLNKVIIPDSVEIIDYRAFMKCENLIKVELPDSLIYIGEEAFSGCYKLNNVILPDSIVEMGQYALAYCERLTNVKLPKNIKILPELLFYHDNSLVNVEIPNGVEKLEDGVFCDCARLNSIVVPNTVKYIGRYCFARCSKIESITLPSDLTFLGYSVFEECYALKGIEIPKGINTLKENTFKYCNSFETIRIPSNITILEKEVFLYCNNLKIVYLPNSIETVGINSFNNINSNAIIYAQDENIKQKCLAANEKCNLNIIVDSTKFMEGDEL